MVTLMGYNSSGDQGKHSMGVPEGKLRESPHIPVAIFIARWAKMNRVQEKDISFLILKFNFNLPKELDGEEPVPRHERTLDL